LNKSKMKWIVLVVALIVMMTLSGCKKKTVAAPPPPPPPPPVAAPTASLTASPATIEKGQTTTLTWHTTDATDVNIEGIGPVQANGAQSASPTSSTTYHLTAKGIGGTQDATARVTVTEPPPPPATPAPSEAEQFASNVKDLYFDYDKFDVRAAEQATVQADAQWLIAHPAVKITMEGHCDDRGSTEYNLALGDNRANSAKQALVQAGVAADRIKTVSFGKEKPFCSEATEACWQQNRRAHLVYGQ